MNIPGSLKVKLYEQFQEFNLINLDHITKKIIIIKRIVPILDSDWLSQVRSCCKILYKHTHLFTFVCCSATTVLEPQPFLRNYIVWRKNMIFIKIITLYLLCFIL